MAQIAAHHESSSFNDHLTTNHECMRHSGEEKKLTTSSRFFQCECISQSQAAFNERTECHFDAVAASPRLSHLIVVSRSERAGRYAKLIHSVTRKLVQVSREIVQHGVNI